MEVLVFESAGSLWGLPAEAVCEVQDPAKVMRLRIVPPWIRGLVDFRGEAVAVIDVAQLAVKETASRPDTIVIVVFAGSSTLALTADRLIGNRQIADDDVISSPSSPPWSHRKGGEVSLIELSRLREALD